MTLFIVGDTDQTLFRFQGAKPEILTNDIDQWLPEIETIKLETNYRSQGQIITKSQQLIANNYSDLGGPYPQELIKSADGVNGDGGKVQFNLFSSADHEALEIANTINELLQDDYNPGDFFIGARTNAQLAYIEGALTKARIPFINLSGASFWEGRHVANVIAYLKLAHNGDRDALEKVYNIPSANHKYGWSDKAGKFEIGDYCPTRYLGKEFLAKIKYNINNIDTILSGRDGWRYQTKKKLLPVIGPTKAQDLQVFVNHLQGIISQAEDVGQIIQVIIDDCYKKYLEHEGADDEGLVTSRLDDLETVRELASQYTDVAEFLAYVDEMIQVAKDAKDKNLDDYTVIATVHKLKGQERRVVFGTGWCEGVCQTSGRDVGLLPHTFSLSPPPNFGVLPAGDMSPMADERCISFVLVSRAIEMCFLSGIENYRTWYMGPSRFIYEMGLI
jgi:DNA helicase-2/ATP-dependent DNA helicase PcrA